MSAGSRVAWKSARSVRWGEAVSSIMARRVTGVWLARPLSMMLPMKGLLLAGLIALLTAAPAAAADPAYAPPDRPGPAIDVPQDKLAQSLECSSGFDSKTKPPVLLMPGTGSNAHDNFSWN